MLHFVPDNMKNGYEAQQTSEKETQMPRFMFEGPQPCTIFGCRSYTTHRLHGERFLLVCSSVRSKQLLCFVHGQGQTKTYNKKNIVGLHNHFPLLTMTPVKSPYINDPKILSKFSFVASQYISQDDAGFLCNRVFFTGTRPDQQNSMWTQLSSQTWQHADHPDCD